jgi:hypothetical protein
MTANTGIQWSESWAWSERPYIFSLPCDESCMCWSRSLVGLNRLRCGLHGCGTSLLYGLPRSKPRQVVSLADCPWTRSLNLQFQHQRWRSLPDSSRYCRLSGDTTDNDFRLIPVPSGQVGWFDGSKRKCLAPSFWSRGLPGGVEPGPSEPKSLRSVGLTTTMR